MFSRGNLIFAAAVALSLSIGWGIRGNYGHETGAMVPGALAALAAVLLSGRPDWRARAGSFAFFGALGWSFGGSISYMQVIGYTHSGHSLSVLYGFACLFLIGFLWAIFGGVGTALPACLDGAALRSLYPLTFLIFAAWLLQDLVVDRLLHVDSAYRQRDPLYWYDTDWLGIAVAFATTLLYALVRRRIDFAVRLAATLCAGWWGGFALFVLLLGWRMTPPRGDNWAGCLGMAIALCLFLKRERLPLLLYTGLLSGTIGGIGFALADCLKLLGITVTGWATNWHSLLEQSYGLINGIGIAAALLVLRRHARRDADHSPKAERVAAAFVLIAITYLNLQKNVPIWVKAKAVPSDFYGLSAEMWFNLAYAGAAALVLHLSFSPNLRLRANRVELFYLAFLWWMVSGNFERALAGFAPQRIVTEGTIFLNALICTALIFSAAIPLLATPVPLSIRWPNFSARLAAASVTVILLCWAAIQLATGSRPVGYSALHIRFGPNATAIQAKPALNQPHP